MCFLLNVWTVCCKRLLEHFPDEYWIITRRVTTVTKRVNNTLCNMCDTKGRMFLCSGLNALVPPVCACVCVCVRLWAAEICLERQWADARCQGCRCSKPDGLTHLTWPESKQVVAERRDPIARATTRHSHSSLMTWRRRKPWKFVWTQHFLWSHRDH